MKISSSMIPTFGNERISPKRGAKVTGSCRKTPKSDGTWKQYFVHGKNKIQKNRGTAWCMETRFQPVFSSIGSQTVYSVFKNRLKPRLFFGRGHERFTKTE
jgi:hypothetical protein